MDRLVSVERAHRMEWFTAVTAGEGATAATAAAAAAANAVLDHVMLT